MQNKISALKIIVLSFSVTFLASCAKQTEADIIADAQSCLDASTSSTVDACLSKVENLTSEGAYLIKCAGSFIKEGFNSSSKLSSALSGISSGSGSNSGSSSTSLIAGLAFTSKSSPSENASFANTTYDSCVKSKSSGLILLSGLSLTSTSLWSLGLSGSSTPPTQAQLESLMGTLANDATASATVGTAVVAMYESNCQSSNSAPGSICSQFNSAVSAVPGGISNPSAIGTQIMTCFSNNNAPGCTGF